MNHKRKKIIIGVSTLQFTHDSTHKKSEHTFKENIYLKDTCNLELVTN